MSFTKMPLGRKNKPNMPTMRILSASYNYKGAETKTEPQPTGCAVHVSRVSALAES